MASYCEVCQGTYEVDPVTGELSPATYPLSSTQGQSSGCHIHRLTPSASSSPSNRKRSPYLEEVARRMPPLVGSLSPLKRGREQQHRRGSSVDGETFSSSIRSAHTSASRERTPPSTSAGAAALSSGRRRPIVRSTPPLASGCRALPLSPSPSRRGGQARGTGPGPVPVTIGRPQPSSSPRGQQQGEGGGSRGRRSGPHSLAAQRRADPNASTATPHFEDIRALLRSIQTAAAHREKDEGCDDDAMGSTRTSEEESSRRRSRRGGVEQQQQESGRAPRAAETASQRFNPPQEETTPPSSQLGHGIADTSSGGYHVPSSGDYDGSTQQYGGMTTPTQAPYHTPLSIGSSSTCTNPPAPPPPRPAAASPPPPPSASMFPNTNIHGSNHTTAPPSVLPEALSSACHMIWQQMRLQHEYFEKTQERHLNELREGFVELCRIVQQDLKTIQEYHSKVVATAAGGSAGKGRKRNEAAVVLPVDTPTSSSYLTSTGNTTTSSSAEQPQEPRRTRRSGTSKRRSSSTSRLAAELSLQLQRCRTQLAGGSGDGSGSTSTAADNPSSSPSPSSPHGGAAAVASPSRTAAHFLQWIREEAKPAELQTIADSLWPYLERRVAAHHPHHQQQRQDQQPHGMTPSTSTAGGASGVSLFSSVESLETHLRAVVREVLHGEDEVRWKRRTDYHQHHQDEQQQEQQSAYHREWVERFCQLETRLKDEMSLMEVRLAGRLATPSPQQQAPPQGWDWEKKGQPWTPPEGSWAASVEQRLRRITIKLLPSSRPGTATGGVWSEDGLVVSLPRDSASLPAAGGSGGSPQPSAAFYDHDHIRRLMVTHQEMVDSLVLQRCDAMEGRCHSQFFLATRAGEEAKAAVHELRQAVRRAFVDWARLLDLAAPGF